MMHPLADPMAGMKNTFIGRVGWCQRKESARLGTGAIARLAFQALTSEAVPLQCHRRPRGRRRERIWHCKLSHDAGCRATLHPFSAPQTSRDPDWRNRLRRRHLSLA
jgi:hypothetical protein